MNLDDLLADAMRADAASAGPTEGLLDAAYAGAGRRRVPVRTVTAAVVLLVGGAAVSVAVVAGHRTSTETIRPAVTPSVSPTPDGLPLADHVLHVVHGDPAQEEFRDLTTGASATVVEDDGAGPFVLGHHQTVNGMTGDVQLNPATRTYVFHPDPQAIATGTGKPTEPDLTVAANVIAGLADGSLGVVDATHLEVLNTTPSAGPNGPLLTYDPADDQVTEIQARQGLAPSVTAELLPRTPANMAKADLVIPDGWTEQPPPSTGPSEQIAASTSTTPVPTPPVVPSSVAPSSSPATAVPAQPVSCDRTNLAASETTDQPTYSPGQTVVETLTVTNTSGEPCWLSYGHATGTAAVLDDAGRTVWRGACGEHGCTAEGYARLLQPGATATFGDSWHQVESDGSTAPGGVYTVDFDDASIPIAPVTFRLTGPVSPTPSPSPSPSAG